ncbi:heterokaryon incompatibility protein-domain-containing protein [Stachybotrys elegans]|uniref:Heterokaryon incompatibility protein-domain-containing protein n=1 Tax=Stachybotrys elegans TaxID=80388 RepID=A0A8K0SU38_9HYPO|nr:heterokaryon incompatibility protein-domain-containing protein [Stachybotrys elegans]
MPQTLNNPYRYEPLSKDKREIRIFTLYPGQASDPLRGKLSTVLMQNKPTYDALSYVWGPMLFENALIIEGNSPKAGSPGSNGGIIQINKNLMRALKDIRHKRKPRAMWVDMICINQEDVSERGHQVSFMADVYREARRVVIWLDEPIIPSSAPFKALSRFQRSIYEVKSESGMREKLGSLFRRKVHLLDHEEQFWLPVIKVLSNAYWRRLWVQQEVYLARKVDCFCRADKVSGEGLLRFVTSLKGVLRDPFYQGKTYRLFESYATEKGPTLFGSYQDGRFYALQTDKCSARYESSLLEIFLNSRKLSSSKREDRVYGLLGISRDYKPGDIDVNYNLSLEQVYSQVIQHYIKTYGSLVFLCYRANTDSLQQDFSFPSWLPCPEKGSSCYPRRFAQWSGAESIKLMKPLFLEKGGFAISVYGFKIDSVRVRHDYLWAMESSIREWKSKVLDEGSMEKLMGALPCLETIGDIRDNVLLEVGYWGLTWPYAKDRLAGPGDEIWMLFGCPAPVILRREDEKMDNYSVTGVARVGFGEEEDDAFEKIWNRGVEGWEFQGYPIEKIEMI